MEKIKQFDRLLPSDDDLEQIVLGAIIIEKDAIENVINIISSNTFYNPLHTHIYDCILDLHKNCIPIDMVTLCKSLSEKNRLKLVGGPYYISSLTNRVASTENLTMYSRILLQYEMQRNMIMVSKEMEKAAYDQHNDIFELIPTFSNKIEGILNVKSDDIQMEAILSGIKQKIETAASFGNVIQGCSSGLSALDEKLGKFQGSKLYIIAARPGMGKSALMKSILRTVGIDEQKTVAVWTLEMTCFELVQGLISEMAEIHNSKFKTGTLSDKEWIKFNEVCTKISNNIKIYDKPRATITEIRRKARVLKKKNDLSMVMIDYLQLMGVEDSKLIREQQVSEISKQCKELSKELDVPVILLAQLSREVDKRAEPIPILSDLRESGSIEQDADVVIFIYRPEYYGKVTDSTGADLKGLAKLIVAKNRGGSLGDAKVRFVNYLTKFEDLEKSQKSIELEQIENPF